MFVGGYLFFKHDQIGNNSYLVTIAFADAEGIQTGSDVEFSGVNVGEVEDYDRQVVSPNAQAPC